MSGAPHKRFISPAQIVDDLGSAAFIEYSGPWDQLRSSEAAKNSMRHKLNYDVFYEQFEPCVKGTGSDDSIGDPCGLLRESAACLICRQRARHHIVDYFLKSGHFTDNAQMVTIIDWRNRRKIFELFGYRPHSFLSEVRELSNKYSKGLKTVGFFEVGLVNGPLNANDLSFGYWSNHCHVIVDGPRSDAFLADCSSQFSSTSKQVVVSRKRYSLARMLCYVTKSPYARRHWKHQPTGPERLILDRFYHSFNLSELFWTSSSIRFSGGRRVQLSALKDIAATQLLVSYPTSRFDYPALRVVNKLSDDYIRLAEERAVEVGIHSCKSMESGLLSSQNAPAYPWVVARRLISARLRHLGR